MGGSVGEAVGGFFGESMEVGDISVEQVPLPHNHQP